MKRRDPDSIRPGLLLVAAALLGASLFTATVVVRDALGISGSEGEQAELERQGGRRIVLRADTDEDGLADGEVADVGPQGSVREQWAEWSEANVPPAELPPLVEAIADPQLSRFHASFDREAELPFRPTGRRGRLASARGLDLPPDASCDVRVLPVADSGFNCLIRVMCGGVVVYPNRSQTAGYVSCELDGTTPRRAVDGMPSVTDGDPSVALDLERGIVTVGDRDHESSLYDVVIELDSTPTRVM